MTILLSFAAGALLVRAVAWPVLRRWWHNIPLDTDLWPDVDRQVCDGILAATAAYEASRREHPSARDERP